MRQIIPYPFLAFNLAIMWLLLAGFTRGQFVLAIIVSLIATHALKALGETSPKINSWSSLPGFISIVLYDIIRSNLSVAYLLLSGNTRDRKSGFITVPLELRNPTALSILAVVITSTPGTAWLDYNSARGELLVHVFDLVDDAAWVDLIKNRYEKPLQEIFE